MTIEPVKYRGLGTDWAKDCIESWQKGESMNLCIFLTTGKTFSFKDTTIVSNNESYLTFTYRAMSDGKVKTAHFQKTNIAGWSVY